ncbi:MAG: hypothetical protein V1723_00560, partial [Candidatus Uhrbacteria bacterium]
MRRIIALSVLAITLGLIAPAAVSAGGYCLCTGRLTGGVAPTYEQCIPNTREATSAGCTQEFSDEFLSLVEQTTGGRRNLITPIGCTVHADA